MTIRLVCFDWGGVILRHCRSWKEGCAVANLPHYPELEAQDLVLKRRALHADYQCGRIASAAFFAALSAATDDRYSIADLEHLHDAWLLTEYAGVGDVIDRIHRAGVETALLSNTNERHWRRHLPEDRDGADFPTVAKLTHRHASHLLGHAKPGVEIYRAFERETGFKGGEILFFDDLAENIATAASLGWRGVLIDHTIETSPQIEKGLAEAGVVGTEPKTP